MDEASHVLIDLYEALERQPSNALLHERLLEVWIELGDQGKFRATIFALVSLSL